MYNIGEQIVQLKIKYHDPDLIRLSKIEQGDWIDLRSAEDITLKAGESKLISLGISMELPPDYEAHIVPRGSTYKNFGVIQLNHMGVIDNSFCGNNDLWMFSAYALRDTSIKKNDRICQFRIVHKQPALDFIEVNDLENNDRGMFGSTGTS